MEQGWRSSESTGFDSQTRRHIWLSLFWFSPLLREVFLRVLQFFPLFKNNTSKFQFDCSEHWYLLLEA